MEAGEPGSRQSGIASAGQRDSGEYHRPPLPPSLHHYPREAPPRQYREPHNMATAALISPSTPYPGHHNYAPSYPPSLPHHHHQHHGSGSGMAGIISPVEPRRAADESEGAVAVGPPHRQLLPSISEVISGATPTQYPPTAPTSAPSVSSSTFPSPFTTASRTFPDVQHDSHVSPPPPVHGHQHHQHPHHHQHQQQHHNHHHPPPPPPSAYPPLHRTDHPSSSSFSESPRPPYSVGPPSSHAPPPPLHSGYTPPNHSPPLKHESEQQQQQGRALGQQHDPSQAPPNGMHPSLPPPPPQQQPPYAHPAPMPPVQMPLPRFPMSPSYTPYDPLMHRSHHEEYPFLSRMRHDPSSTASHVSRHLEAWGYQDSLDRILAASRTIFNFAEAYKDIAKEQQTMPPIFERLPIEREISDMLNNCDYIRKSLESVREVVQSASAHERSLEAKGKRPYDDDDDVAMFDAMKNTFSLPEVKKRRGRAAPPGRCHSCNRIDTPEWRRGPDGARTLCNACGLHYAKLERKRQLDARNGVRPKPAED